MSNFDKVPSYTHSQFELQTTNEIVSPPLSQSNSQNHKFYSLMPDLISGWKPKNLKIPSPIFIKYRQKLISLLLQYYKDSPQKIIYRGPRYSNSIKYHENIKHDYMLKYGVNSEDIPLCLQNQLKSEQNNNNNNEKVMFKGMNPLLRNDQNLIFQSQFQSGNLDLVIKCQTSEEQYNLFLRPDTNTSGHMQWFYFKIKNKNKCIIKLNICNNKKSATLFQRGMKPYVYSMKNQQTKVWSQQGCSNVNYSRYQIAEQKDEIRQDNPFKGIKLQNYYQLSFSYEFQYQNDEVSFAYCPPYTFSMLKQYLGTLTTITQHQNEDKNNNSHHKVNINSQTGAGSDIEVGEVELTGGQKKIVIQQKFGTSLSGLEIPMLTITDHTLPNEQKMCIIAIGRIHPGQSNSSYAIQGFINYLVSAQAKQIRKHVVFKIIPMLNPDGVVFGNYRTSLSGKDLNRQFKTKFLELIPEIVDLKQLVKKLKYDNKYNIPYFLDFHGHSLKKNVFFYGPEYDIWSLKYQKAKILAKIIASKTDMFRMQSCLYKVANFKQTTARAYMLAYIPYCYTIQSSVGIYRNRKNVDVPIEIGDWGLVGWNIGESFDEIIEKHIQCLGKVNKRKQKKQNQAKNLQIKPIIQSFSLKQSLKEEQSMLQNTLNTVIIPTKVRSSKYLDPIKNLKQRYLKSPQIPIESQIIKIDEQDCQSDKFSQGNSDCQSDSNDFLKQQYNSLREKIINVMQHFQLMMIGNGKNMNNNIFWDKRGKKMIKIGKKNSKEIRNGSSNHNSNKKSIEMLLVPSLKHKLTKIVLSEKKIGFMSSLNKQKNNVNQYRNKRLLRNSIMINY